MRIQDRDGGQYLTSTNTWTSTVTNVNATLGAGTTNRTWSLDGRMVTTNRNMLVSAQAFTAATGGTGDSTMATKKIESFSTDDQTPTTAISGPSGIQTSTSFTVTGTANDDKGVNSLSFWFRDERSATCRTTDRQRHLQHVPRHPDVIGATNATWSYEVTLPHEGVWRGIATARDP